MPKRAEAVFPWTGASYVGVDGFYAGGTVMAYETGATGTYVVSWLNNTGGDVTGVQIYVNFDWGGTLTRGVATSDAASTAVAVKNGETAVLTLSFTIPATTTASNMVKHAWRIYRTQSASAPVVTQIASGTNFAVYSADQAAYQASRALYNAKAAAVAGAAFGGFISPAATQLQEEAKIDNTAAIGAYAAGDFATAKTTMASAVTKLNAAMAAEGTGMGAFGYALMNKWNAQADAAASPRALYILGGIGALLGGLGIIGIGLAYLFKRKGE